LLYSKQKSLAQSGDMGKQNHQFTLDNEGIISERRDLRTPGKTRTEPRLCPEATSHFQPSSITVMIIQGHMVGTTATMVIKLGYQVKTSVDQNHFSF